MLVLWAILMAVPPITAAAPLIACASPGKSSATSSGKSSKSGKSGAKSKKAQGKPCRGVGSVERGQGVWYGGKFHGRKTASGERFDKNAMTAAHKRLPFHTVVRVTNLRNGRSVQVRINDRGPYRKGRIIDVSEAAAKKLGFFARGVTQVKLEVVKLPRSKKRKCL